MSTIMLKKKDRARELIRQHEALFKCPVCGASMAMEESGSMACQSRHSFDLSRKGYLNFLTSGSKPVYSRELFEARHIVSEAGFYDPLIDELAKMIGEYRKSVNKENISILDAGCGEGSHLYMLSQRIKESFGYSFLGVDISKDSINIAANNNSNIMWCVADLAKLPLSNRNIDVVLNILSPANYIEFDRILSNTGIVIKVVPEHNYLKELREIIYEDREEVDYSNDKVVSHFTEKLDVMNTQSVSYSFPVNEELLPHLIKMTPLTWGEDADIVNHRLEEALSNITVDLKIIVGRKYKK